MQITKNDIYSYIKKVTPQDTSSSQKNTVSAIPSIDDSSSSTITRLNIDHLRQKVMSLQSDVNEIQTTISKNQSIIEMLANPDSSLDLISAIENHIQNAFKAKDFHITQKNPAQLKEKLVHENSSLIENLKRKEVQLENIFSTGTLNNSENTASKLKNIESKTSLEKSDVSPSEMVFNKISAEKIAELLK